MTGCPFCHPEPASIFHHGQEILGLWDAFPASPGHALLVTRRHVADWFSAAPDEQRELFEAVGTAREAILKVHRPDGFNIGLNVGQAAGQTVMHLHLHVIPRYRGDAPDPRGGVRHAVPGKGNYLDRPRLTTGLDTDHLLPVLHNELDRATRADIAVSFVQNSGLDQLEPRIVDLLQRQGHLRLITGDYLGITDPDALVRLLDLAQDYPDQVELRVFEARHQSFHPKAYLFVHGDGCSQAFVGSSNLSGPALHGGVEWNYRLGEAAEVSRAFESLLGRTTPLTVDWVDDYRARRQPPRLPGGASVLAEGVAEPPAPRPVPHATQREALNALEETRRAGNRAGLVVLATGLGKTLLAAFDSLASRRVLFVAHRREILMQAHQAFRRLRPDARMGLYDGIEQSPSADLLFASISTLGRADHLRRFARDHFDYVVVDEFHHAHAASYRGLIAHFTPSFFLGLTATPERADGGDLLALCGQNLVYRCDLTEGIRRSLLCPFHYRGVPDLIDYRNIPWRNGQFVLENLETALVIESRAENALENLRRYGGKRVIAFCVSQRHARFMADYFQRSGLRSVAVFAGPDSAPRTESLERLGNGELDILCCVDMFNEGVDLPAVDTVLMLRPTESRVVWLQQLGRGLRRSEGKDVLRVIDYIGNHRTFLLKPQTLFGLEPGDKELARCFELLRDGKLPGELPPGCEVTYDLEAVDMLRGLLRLDRGHALTRYYQQFVEQHGRRPLAVEAYQDRLSIRSVRPQYGSWLGFVRAQGAEIDPPSPFLLELEKTSMTKSYKMIVLQAMLNLGELPGSVSIKELSAEFARIASRSARLAEDVSVDLKDARAVQALVRKNPVEAWLNNKSFFRLSGDRFESTFEAVAPELIQELVDWRLAEYLDRSPELESSYELKVSQTNGKPILFLPDRTRNPGLPEGPTPLRVDGRLLVGKFVKVALNVLSEEPGGPNVLPGLLREWFGPDAGQPGTSYRVRLAKVSGEWVLAPA